MKEIINEHGSNNIWTGPGKLKVVDVEDANTGWEKSDIEVYVKGKQIGFVPESRIKEVAEHKKTQSRSVLVQLSYSPDYDICSAKLFTPNRKLPTRKMEYAVDQILKQNPKLEKPEKTFDAYRQFLNRYRGGLGDQTKYKVKYKI